MDDSDNTYATPQDAEAAFYAAFQNQDLEAMTAVWVDSDDAVCIHPMGERLSGATAVLASWARIFAGDGRMRFDIAEPIYVTDDNTSVHYIYENIHFGANFSESSQVLATNVYVRTADGWRIQAHHGSPLVAPSG
ncbi:MAG: nuclear transport factor 2 family protein, partial [Gammaproteobacteria bacterium]|nr:nuclear transport factor 2 family protein [Gammaproteobacteria bacterium]